MTETSVALCATLLGAKAWDFLQRHRSVREALATAKRSVQQQLGGEGAEAGAARGAAGQPAGGEEAAAAARQAPQAAQQQQYRTPTIPEGAAGVRAGAAEVSPLIQRGAPPRAASGGAGGWGARQVAASLPASDASPQAWSAKCPLHTCGRLPALSQA